MLILIMNINMAVMNKDTYSKIFVGLVLGIFVPVLSYGLHSFSYGFFTLAFLIHVVFQVRISSKVFLILLSLELFILVQVIVLDSFSIKSFISSFGLLYCSIIFIYYGRLLGTNNRKIDLLIFLAIPILTTFISVLSFSLTKYTDYYFVYNLPKPCFPFSEPSHLALFLVPLSFFVMAYVDEFYKFIIIAILLFLSIFFESLTFATYTILGVIICAWSRRFVELLSFLVLTLLVLYCSDILVNDRYMIKRISAIFNSETSNMSALVFLQGWQSVQDTFLSHPFGLGFQFLGNEPPNQYSLRIKELSGGYVNRQDGGFLFAKLFSEFGFFLVPMMASFFYFLKRNYYKICALNPPKARSIIYLYIGLLPGFFVRDVGYFSYTTFFFFSVSGYLFSVANLTPRSNGSSTFI